MRHKALWLAMFVLAAAAAAWGQQGERVDQEMVAKIRAEGFERSQVMQTLFQLTDVTGPRLANSPGYDAAARWARDQMQAWGLSQSRLEAWGEFGYAWSLDYFHIDMLKPYYQPLIAYPRAWVRSTNGPVNGKPVIFTPQTKEEMEKFRGKLKGALVLMRPLVPLAANFTTPDARRFDEAQLTRLAESREAAPARPAQAAGQASPPGLTETQIMAFLREEGVSVLLESGRGTDGTVFVTGSRNYRLDSTLDLPAAVLAPEHYNRLYRLTEAGIDVEVRVQIESRFDRGDPQDYNVLAEIPGADPRLKDEIVMIGGHLDSWHAATGATDNAAGCAVAMEAARILLAVGAKPRRTIRVALWASEERGHSGSRGYVAQHLKPGSPEYEKFSAYFNHDNGTGRIRGVYLQGNEAVRPIFAAWLKPFQDLEAGTLTINNTGGSDHESFDAVGLPGFQFIQDPIHYSSRTHHSNMDDYDHLIPKDLMQSAVIMASFAYHAAMREEKLPRKPAKAADK
jgi:carboxypeptidase Q